MKVRDWINARTPPPPAALQQQALAALGRDAEAPESRTADVCLGAAARALVQQSGQGLAGSGAELCRAYGAIVIGIGGLEPLFDRRKIFVLG